MHAIGDALKRLITVGAIPDCQRCGGSMAIMSEKRLAITPPVFDVKCRCARCGAGILVRQVLAHFE